MSDTNNTKRVEARMMPAAYGQTIFVVFFCLVILEFESEKLNMARLFFKSCLSLNSSLL
jgi:hypothetical protein